MGAVPDVRAGVHGGDADWAGGGVAVSGRGSAAEGLERLAAEGNLANALLQQGKYAQAERLLRDLDAVRMRV